jgi:hypothetical protein
MKRGRAGRNKGGLSSLLGTIAMAGASMYVLTQLPNLLRYFKMRRMSAGDHPVPPRTDDEASRAHTPRWGTTHWPIR